MCARLSAILLALLAGLSQLAAQDSLRTAKGPGEYALVVYGGGGLSLYSKQPETPAFLQANTTNTGLCGTLRVMWHPDHLLRLGFETGSMRFYRYTFTDGENKGQVDLDAVPLLLVWSMPIHTRFNVFIGYGYYRLTSKLDYITETDASSWSLGWMAAASYAQPLNKDLGLNFELKCMNAAATNNTLFTAQVQLQWKFLRW